MRLVTFRAATTLCVTVLSLAWLTSSVSQVTKAQILPDGEPCPNVGEGAVGNCSSAGGVNFANTCGGLSPYDCGQTCWNKNYPDVYTTAKKTDYYVESGNVVTCWLAYKCVWDNVQMVCLAQTGKTCATGAGGTATVYADTQCLAN